MKNFLKFTTIVILFSMLAACIPVSLAAVVPTYPPVATPQQSPAQPAVREAQVLSVDVPAIVAPQPQFNAVVRGNLTESCAALQNPQVSFDSGIFQIKLMVESPSDKGCVQLTTPFEQTIPLDTSRLTPGIYTVIANGVSTTFEFIAPTQPPAFSLQLVVRATDGSLQIANVDLPLNPTARPSFNNFLSEGGTAEGNAYVLDNNQAKVVSTDGTGFHDLGFVKSPTTYGLAVWPGDAKSQPRLAWATQISPEDQSSTIKISSLDGTQVDTLLKQGSTNPPSQLMAQFFSPDGQWLYFSKEPVGVGGFILFGGASSLYKVNVDTKEVLDVIPTDLSEEPTGCLDDISSDFLYVAEHCWQNVIRIRDLTTGGASTINPPAEINTGNQLVGSARFSPDGKRLAYAIGKGTQADVQGWVVVSDTAIDNSMVILLSKPGTYYTVAGWLDDETLLVQTTNPSDCTPYCKSELFAVLAGGSDAKKVADGSFVAAVPNEAIIQLPSPTATPATTACTDEAKYISDDGLDGTIYAPNRAFTKTWTVENIGTCTWDSDYLVYYISGALMTQQPGYWLVQDGQTVAPGHTVDISVGMTSPVENGKYRVYWGLKNAAGQVIPLEGGADGDSFYVEIRVSDGSDLGTVTATDIEIEQEQGSGEICTANATYYVHAYITTDGPTTASYEIGSTAGQIPAGYFEDNGDLSYSVTGNLVFNKAGMKTINLRLVGPFPYPDDITVTLRVNGEEWISTKLPCPGVVH